MIAKLKSLFQCADLVFRIGLIAVLGYFLLACSVIPDMPGPIGIPGI